MIGVLLGFGGNLGDPESAFRGALEALAHEGRVASVSRLWRTCAVGPEQPTYLNAAAVILWPQGPRSLLAQCRELEIAAGRDRRHEARWGPRMLDLDLLLADAVICRGPTLVLPHPRLHERRFALEPAAEVAPDWVHPACGLTVAQLADAARLREPDAVVEVSSFDV